MPALAQKPTSVPSTADGESGDDGTARFQGRIIPDKSLLLLGGFSGPVDQSDGPALICGSGGRDLCTSEQQASARSELDLSAQ